MSDQRPRAEPTQAADGAKKKSKLPDISGAIIDVYVGNQETFHVHKNVIESSKFLQNSIKPEWMTKLRPIELPDDKPAIVKLYIQWLYSNRSASVFPKTLLWLTLVDMYVLGEKYMDAVFQNAVMDVMVACYAGRVTNPNSHCVNRIYDNTTASSPARRLMVDIWKSSPKAHWDYVKEPINLFNSDFINDIIQALVQVRQKIGARDKRLQDSASYHIKDQEETEKPKDKDDVEMADVSKSEVSEAQP